MDLRRRKHPPARRGSGGRRLGNRGVAAVEFGLILPGFASLLAGVVDFSLFYLSQSQLSAALTAGAQYAFTQGQTESGATLTADVTNFINAVSPVGLSALTVQENNGLSASSCYCIDGATPTYTGPVTCGATCTDGSGSTAGKYVSISGSFTFTATFLPDQTFFGSPTTATVTVRLQ